MFIYFFSKDLGTILDFTVEHEVRAKFMEDNITGGNNKWMGSCT